MPDDFLPRRHEYLTESTKSVFLLPEFHTAFINSMYPDKQIQLMKERLFSNPFALYVKKDPSLVKRLDAHVKNLVSSGLVDYWMAKNMGGENIKIHPQKVPEKLTLSQLEAIFFICAVLYVISILVFVFELIIWRFQQ